MQRNPNSSALPIFSFWWPYHWIGIWQPRLLVSPAMLCAFPLHLELFPDDFLLPKMMALSAVSNAREEGLLLIKQFLSQSKFSVPQETQRRMSLLATSSTNFQWIWGCHTEGLPDGCGEEDGNCLEMVEQDEREGAEVMWVKPIVVVESIFNDWVGKAFKDTNT